MGSLLVPQLSLSQVFMQCAWGVGCFQSPWFRRAYRMLAACEQPGHRGTVCTPIGCWLLSRPGHRGVDVLRDMASRFLLSQSDGWYKR